jgi:hypothetical protein
MLTCPYCHARSFASPKAMSCHILASVSCPQHLIQLAPLLSCSYGFVNRVTDSTSEIPTRESHRSGRLLTTNADCGDSDESFDEFPDDLLAMEYPQHPFDWVTLPSNLSMLPSNVCDW